MLSEILSHKLEQANNVGSTGSTGSTDSNNVESTPAAAPTSAEPAPVVIPPWGQALINYRAPAEPSPGYGRNDSDGSNDNSDIKK